MKWYRRCRIGGSFYNKIEIPLRGSLLYLYNCIGATLLSIVLGLNFYKRLLYKNCQVGSLAGAAHLLNDNTGDLRSVQCERKSHVEFKGKS